MLITSLYNIADTFFVGHINTQSTAAIGITFTAMFLMQAIGFFFGHGSGNYISRELGAKRQAVSCVLSGCYCYNPLRSGLAAPLLFCPIPNVTWASSSWVRLFS